MGPTDGTLGNSDTAKLQLTTSSEHPLHPAFPHGARASRLGQLAWQGRGIGPCPPLTTDPTAVAKGLQRALARWLWALPPRCLEQGCADAGAILKESRAESAPLPANCTGAPKMGKGTLTRAFPQAQPDLSGQPVPVTWRVPLPWNCSGAEEPPRYSAQDDGVFSSCAGKSSKEGEYPRTGPSAVPRHSAERLGHPVSHLTAITGQSHCSQ